MSQGPNITNERLLGVWISNLVPQEALDEIGLGLTLGGGLSLLGRVRQAQMGISSSEVSPLSEEDRVAEEMVELRVPVGRAFHMKIGASSSETSDTSSSAWAW